MKAKLTLAATSFAAALLSAVEVADAAANTRQVGQHAADLLSGWLKPLIMAVAGAWCVVAIVKREVGVAIVTALAALIAGLFVIDPKQAQALFEGIYKAIL
jgi:LytS/YehU family sensor histidine kinase